MSKRRDKRVPTPKEVDEFQEFVNNIKGLGHERLNKIRSAYDNLKPATINAINKNATALFDSHRHDRTFVDYVRQELVRSATII
jgi:hypothetical protein